MKLTIRNVRSDDELKQVQNIRKMVFTHEQKVLPEIDKDGLDDTADHVIAMDNDNTIGTLRIRFFDNNAKIERLALLKEYRGRGIGKQMLEYAINYCKKKDVKEIIIHAQCHATGLYEKMGFKPKGNEFKEAGIDHKEMVLDDSDK